MDLTANGRRRAPLRDKGPRSNKGRKMTRTLKPKDLPIALRRQLGVRGRSKYGVRGKESRTVNSITFDSAAEMRWYLQLVNAQAGGAVLYFLRQVPFHLPGNTRYTADFMVVYADGRIEYQDVKGARTAAFIRSKKQVEAIYPIQIREIKA